MKHYDQTYVKLDKEELQELVRFLDLYNVPEEIKELSIRLREQAYPTEEPIERFRRTIRYYDDK